MNFYLATLALSIILIVRVNGQCSYDNAQDRVDCGYPGISPTACIADGCCWDNSQPETIWCFSPNSEEDREGKGERETANQFTLTTAAIQYAGSCLFSCTSIERRMRLPITSQVLGISECLTIGGCYDEADPNFPRRCFHPSRVVSTCPEPQCQVPSGDMQLCQRDNVLESTCTNEGCCYTRVDRTFKCYRSEVPAVEIEVTEAPTTTEEPTFIDLLRQNTGGDLRGFSVVDLLSNSLNELSQRKRNITLFPPTTTTTTEATTTTTTVATTTRQPTLPTTQPPAIRRRVCQWGRCRFVFSEPPPPAQCFPVDCGRPRLYPGSPIPLPSPTPASPSLKKIVGGTRAYPFSYPWMAMVIKTEGSTTFLCGATVICERWLITAAHCFNRQSQQTSTPDLDAIFYTVHVGRFTGLRQKAGSQVQTFEGREDIAYVQPHPDFVSGVNRGILRNDIGLIRLRKSIKFDNFSQPACMPRVRPVVADVLWATGWGEHRDQGPDASGLKQLGVRILNETFCQRNVPGFEDPPGVLCGGGERNQDTCVGDSGGPMVGSVPVGRDRSGRTILRWVVYGLTSIGSPSCNTQEFDRQPAVYTDVSYFRDWIREETQNCCL